VSASYFLTHCPFCIYGLLIALAESQSWTITPIPFPIINAWFLPGFYTAAGLWIVSLYYRQVYQWRKIQNKKWNWRWWLTANGNPRLALTLCLGWIGWVIVFLIAQWTYNGSFNSFYDFWLSCGLLLGGSVLALIYFHYAPENLGLIVKLSLLYIITPSLMLAWLGLWVPPSLRFHLFSFSLIAHAILLAGLPLLYRYLIIRPLYRLIEFIQKVDEGDWNTSLPVSFKDEIGYLAESFSNIINRVTIAAHALRQANFTLEQKIDEQTHLLKELNQAHQQTIILSRHLVELQEAERRRLAGELHDEIGQALTGIKLTLELGIKTAKSPQQYTYQAQQILSQLIQKVNDISLSLRPVMLDEFGLLSALLYTIEQYTQQMERVFFQHDGLEGQRFSTELETAAFRIVQEALTNVARYANTKEVSVRLLNDGTFLLIEIEDHGVGFDIIDKENQGYSYGIAGMRERAALLGGEFHIDSAPGAGTFIWTKIPLSNQPSSACIS
jgi:signal transduction histidine kinase